MARPVASPPPALPQDREARLVPRDEAAHAPAAAPPLRPLLSAVIALLAVGHLTASVSVALFDFTAGGFVSRLDLTTEQSFGTWFPAALLAVGGAAALALARIARERRLRRGWWALGAMFVVLSLDEVAAVHEVTGEVMRRFLDLPGFLFYAWMLPALIAVVAFVVWQRAFWRALPRPLARRLLLAGAVYVVGAVGLEMVESAIFVADGARSTSFQQPGYQMLSGIEEVLEMSAAGIALLALLRHLAELAPTWLLRITPAPGIGAGPAPAARPAAAAR